MGQLDGRCMCGAITYSSDADPLFTAICHCKNCQRQTGTAFSLVVGVPVAALDVQGELSDHVTVGEDHGHSVHRRFCGTCGSPIFSVSEGNTDIAIIKAGTLDDTSWLKPQLEVWGESAQDWVEATQARPRLPRGVQQSA